MKDEEIKRKIKEIKESINEKDVFHELCLLFPFKESLVITLVRSINKKGLILPIMTYNGKILDGRHRWYACKILGKLPISTDLPLEINPKDYIEAMNFERKELSPTERIEIALKLDEWRPTKKESLTKIDILNEYRHNKKIAEKAHSTPKAVKQIKEVLIIVEEKPELEKEIEKARKDIIRVDTLYRKSKETNKTIKQIKEEKETIEKKVNRELRKKVEEEKKRVSSWREKCTNLRLIYNDLKDKHIQIINWIKEKGLWEAIKEDLFIKKKDYTPTIKELRKAELI